MEANTQELHTVVVLMPKTIDNGFTARHLLHFAQPNFSAFSEHQQVCSVFSFIICLFNFFLRIFIVTLFQGGDGDGDNSRVPGRVQQNDNRDSDSVSDGVVTEKVKL